MMTPEDSQRLDHLTSRVATLERHIARPAVNDNPPIVGDYGRASGLFIGGFAIGISVGMLIGAFAA